MHDSTRRAICRLAFLACCLAPSASLFAWITYRATPIHSAHENAVWIDKIYEATGFIAEIEAIQHPTPSRTILTGVNLNDPDGEMAAARIRALEITSTDQGIVALMSQPEVEPNQLRGLGGLLFNRVLRGRTADQQFQLVSGELTLHDDSGASTITDLRCIVNSTNELTAVTIDFQLAGIEMRKPAQLRISRDRSAGTKSTAWEIRTGDTAMPCRLLSDYIDGLELLGDRCQFAGTAWVRRDDQSWSSELAGRFFHTDLDSLVAPFPHKLSGVAEIELSHISFREGKLVEAAGALESNGGVISHSLLLAATRSLKLGSNVQFDQHADSSLSYRHLAVGFHIDEAGLQLFGLCGSADEGIVLVGTSGNVLLSTQGEMLSAIDLTRTLVPYSQFQVPATTATESLLRALPFPKPTLPTGGTAIRPYSPLKLR